MGEEPAAGVRGHSCGPSCLTHCSGGWCWLASGLPLHGVSYPPRGWLWGHFKAAWGPEQKRQGLSREAQAQKSLKVTSAAAWSKQVPRPDSGVAYESSPAALTKRHTLSGLHNRNLFLTLLGAESPRSRCSRVGFFCGLPPQLGDGRPLPAPSRGLPSVHASRVSLF